MTSIKQIAKEVGASVSTVSRALNGYHDVNPKTREKVIEAARNLNYFPSSAARSLVTKRTYMIGLFFGDNVNSGFEDPFFQKVLSAIRELVGDAGYDLLVFTNKNKERATYTTLCRERGVDGTILILTGREKQVNSQLTDLQNSGIPCVAIDVPLEGDRCTYVESDNFLGMKKAVSYLAGLGHRQIAFIGGDEVSKISLDRLNGYRSGLNDAGISYDPDLIEMGYYAKEYAELAVKNILKKNKKVTAFVCASDVMAFAAIETLQEEGCSVPGEASVIGFDDVNEAAGYHIPLTTVKQNKEEIGRAATEQLLKIIEDPALSPSPIMIPCELIVRQSAAEAPKKT
ncbi:LacI family DNA-binding transcriptional regulator [Marinococcus halophilus]|uniref:LacI family transcriptional regulator n=1 Tax=Marinococcus halophilus TaxID=1371 RepID=A0A510Y494_MARHA|nr:LacI family DNA-binding transcriptional regulator [Marinococcus halophilus]GEK58166.1 LacI family transcriptional regulator [Marinococcus halophilus]